MKLPWVSRAAYEAELAERLRETARANAWWDKALALLDKLARADVRYDALLDKFTTLRLAGAVEPVVYTAPVPRPVDALEVLIGQESGGDVRKRAFMIKQLRKDRASGMSDDEIARRIINGQSVEDGIPA